MHVITLTGSNLAKHVKELAKLRVEVFAEWPYLYKGQVETDVTYIDVLTRHQEACLVAVFDADELVGAATASPLSAQDDWVKTPFLHAGMPAHGIMYFGESVLKPPYRGQGYGHAFFEGREAQARAHGYTQATFCSVMRSDDDPRRPPHYRALDPFWTKRGYEPWQGVKADLSWPEVGQDNKPIKDSSHTLQFWGRTL
jgi:GNAT superfamily N-acetyltransferase